jgi:hypothetical protein
MYSKYRTNAATVTADADQPHFSVSGIASDAYGIWIRKRIRITTHFRYRQEFMTVSYAANRKLGFSTPAKEYDKMRLLNSVPDP